MIRNIIVLIACCCVTANVSYSADVPGEKWWPSEWGADDQLGALNRLTPAKVLAAAGLITEGKIYDMGRVFEEDMPLFDLTPQHRKYSLTVPGATSWGPHGRQQAGLESRIILPGISPRTGHNSTRSATWQR